MDELEPVLDPPYAGGVGAGMYELLLVVIPIIDEDTELDPLGGAEAEEEEDAADDERLLLLNEVVVCP